MKTDDLLISRKHASLRVNGDGTGRVRDLSSTNGTFVNDKKVSRVRLSDGDRLTVGRVTFVVHSEMNADGGNPKTTWTST